MVHVEDEDRKLWDIQSKQDLDLFYSQRQKELKDGGMLFICSVGSGNKHNPVDDALVASTTNWKPSVMEILRDHNLEEISGNFMLPLVLRQENELKPDNELSVIKSESLQIEVQSLKQLRDSQCEDEYAKAHYGIFSTFVKPYWQAQLITAGVEQQYADDLVDKMLQKVAKSRLSFRKLMIGSTSINMLISNDLH
eukprot:CAMPEP_0114995236 /NCGR_PEP_ID=MMETSP0216-20121206/13612_1 /TAXON_ID=223996 /ORGANISM="Protocruzia adherens, Strain Boccale" /LENGTH=194 /DNA_ID=CAMNT_0002359245 /DNA_START=468 /DNA_END=1052 /DNA_ORIENTATION=+